eukprot:365758-Chlamydomonas_euryale.AAC.8
MWSCGSCGLLGPRGAVPLHLPHTSTLANPTPPSMWPARFPRCCDLIPQQAQAATRGIVTTCIQAKCKTSGMCRPPDRPPAS